MSNLTDIAAQLKRMETKIVRGFEEMGVDTNVDHEWISVDDAARVIYLSTLARSLMVIRKEAPKRGATNFTKPYDLVHQGRVVGTLYL